MVFAQILIAKVFLIPFDMNNNILKKKILLDVYSLVAYAYFRALKYRTFFLLFSERYIPK